MGRKPRLLDTPKQRRSLGGMVFTGLWWLFDITAYLLDIKSISDERSWLVEHFLSPWTPGVLCVLCFIAWGCITYKLKQEWQQHVEGERRLFAEEWKSYTKTREAFWFLLDDAFAKLQQTQASPGLVRDFVEKAGFPVDILRIPCDVSLYNYARETVGGWGNKREELFRFCRLLYPQEGDPSILTYDERKSLDGLRRILSKFWNEWEIRCNDQGGSLVDIMKPDLIRGQTPDVVMLAYLEIARGLQRRENSRGKQGLFTVARDFWRISNFL